IRAAGSGCDRAPVRGTNDDRDRASPAYRRRRRSHLRHRGWDGRRGRASRRAAAQGRTLHLVLPPAAAGAGTEPAGRGRILGLNPGTLGRATMSANANSYVITPPPQAAIAVAGTDKMFPVRRIWCVGRNYAEHIREMGHDVRDPPFFFSKPADAIVADGANVPYPSLTKDMHHEVELVVALKSGGRNIPLAKALDRLYV